MHSLRVNDSRKIPFLAFMSAAFCFVKYEAISRRLTSPIEPGFTHVRLESSPFRHDASPKCINVNFRIFNANSAPQKLFN